MNPPSLYSRLTPTTRTPDSGVVRIASEGRASRAVARALGYLIERLILIGPDVRGVVGGLEGVDPANPLLVSVRDALRQLSARSREGALLCRVVERTLILEGVPVDRAETEDPLLGGLLARLIVLDVGSLTVREGAASGELLTLARLLAQPRVPESLRTSTPARGLPITGGDTPTTVSAVDFADETPRELLRTWSVLVTPLLPSRHGSPKTEMPGGAAGIAVGTALSRLSSARTDDAASTAVAGVQEVLDLAQRRGDAVAVEQVAIGVMRQLHVVGDQGGRLALERVVRLLLRAPLLSLASARLPFSVDRQLLVQLFARAGDAGVATLLQQLLSTDDALSRRAYFDSIVAMDVGSSQLFDVLNDGRWYVVRNAAALLGEMGVEHADEALIPLLHHADERIRIAVARALMRLRTVKALHALHGVIDDRQSEIRRLAAAAFGLTGAGGASGMRPPAARLSAALERETDEDVALEMLAALGRLGSADAVQRLLRIALPASHDMSGPVASGPRDPWLRIAAVEALVRARGAQMRPVIDMLRADPDAEVAAAAEGLQASLATNGTA